VRCFAGRERNAWRLFERACEQGPQREALVFEGRRWTYAALRAEVEAAARGLRARGLAPGERIALFVSNRPEFVVAWLAAMRLGAIAVPIGIREQRPGLAYMLGQCGAAAVCFDDSLAERVPGRDEVASLRLRIAIGGPAPDAIAWEDVAVAADRDPLPPLGDDEQACAVILYTSGTTGRPKGAMLTHLSIAHSVQHFVSCMKLAPGDRSALAVPASHVTGLIAILATTFAAGGAVVMLREFKAPQFIAVAAQERVTMTIIVPAMYNLCLLTPGFAQADLSAWRIAGFGGAPMPEATIAELARRLPQLVLVNAYGATETTSPTTIMPLGENDAHADSVGVAAPCADVIVVDDDGRELPRGEPGELWIGGPMVVSGYWDNPQATRESFTAGYWHSGDIGSIDAQGYVRVFDRK
jgi:O-succinylbenzoic acid--CoA ligase